MHPPLSNLFVLDMTLSKFADRELMTFHAVSVEILL